jgi:hypothetical protein
MSNILGVLTVGAKLGNGMGARGTGVLLHVIDILDPRYAVIAHPQCWAVFSRHMPTCTLLFPDLIQASYSQSAPDLLID